MTLATMNFVEQLKREARKLHKAQPFFSHSQHLEQLARKHDYSSYAALLAEAKRNMK